MLSTSTKPLWLVESTLASHASIAGCTVITGIIIIIIIINEKIIVAFSPRTTRTRYKVKKNKTARYVVFFSRRHTG